MTRRARLIVFAVVPAVLLWELVGRLQLSFILPPFTEVLAAGLKVWTSAKFINSLGGSISSLVVGFLLASVTGITLGVLMGRFDRVAWAFELYINVMMSSPKAALIPIIVLVFGFGQAAVMVTVFMYAFFPLVVNTAAGVRQTPQAMTEMARSFGASEWQIARRVMLPSAAPLVFGGIRFAASRSVKGVIIGEQLIAIVGIGALIQLYGAEFQFPQLYSIILLVALAGLGLQGGFGWLQGRLMPWVPRESTGSRAAGE